MDGLGYACALLLAGVFVWAGAAKLARPAATAAGFTALGVPGGAAARAVPLLELAVAAVLLAAPRPGAIVALVMLGAFTVVVARAVRSGLREPCNCFGAARADPVSWADVVRNVMLAGVSLLSMAASRPVVPSAPAVAGAAGVFACGYVALRAVRRHRG